MTLNLYWRQYCLHMKYWQLPANLLAPTLQVLGRNSTELPRNRCLCPAFSCIGQISERFNTCESVEPVLITSFEVRQLRHCFPLLSQTRARRLHLTNRRR